MTEKDNTDTSKIYDMYFHHESFTQLRSSKEYHVFQTRNEKIYLRIDYRYGGCRPIKPIVHSLFVEHTLDLTIYQDYAINNNT